MKSILIAAFVAPGVALTAVGSQPASSARAPLKAELSANEAVIHAASVFSRADLDRSVSLSADEYVSLAIVTAELSRLNGFMSIEAEGREQLVMLPVKAPGAISRGERARVEAVARGEFYAAAGSDSQLSLEEYVAEQAARFSAADRNRNGILKNNELGAFAAREALLSKASA